MNYLHLALLAISFFVGYQMGKKKAEEQARVQQEQEGIILESLEAQRKQVAAETKKQLKFENDEREKVRKQIEKEERSKL